ncbi:MAG TPA: cytochrome c [Verrucomicrobiales bacterium]|nr:cytochrome c [Verrucomicrobiales bacterium]
MPRDPAVEWVQARLGSDAANGAAVLEQASHEFGLPQPDLLLRVGEQRAAAGEEVRPLAELLVRLPVETLAERRNALRRALLTGLDPGLAAAVRVALLRVAEDPAERMAAELEEEDLLALLEALMWVRDAELFALLYSRLKSLAPGGPASFRHGLDVQRAALVSLARSPQHRQDAVALLRRVARLSGDPETRGAARQALEDLGEGVAGAGEGSIAGAQDGSWLDPELMARGKEVYMRPGLCATCHQPNGMGMLGAFPPLVNSPWMGGDPDRMIKAVAGGLMGNIEIAGQEYNNVMPPQGLLVNDEDLAAVLTYVRNSWGNSASVITPEMVKRVKEENRGKVGMWTVEELLKAHPLETEDEAAVPVTP